MRAVGHIVAVVALAVFAIGLAIVPLTSPAATRIASQRFSLAEEAGLPGARMTELAEGVRAYVTGTLPAEKALPATVDGRPAFDASAVSHLADVRAVLRGAGFATGALAALVTGWLGVWVARRRPEYIARALKHAAIVDAVLVIVLALVAVTSFDAFFSAFHGLFFAAGTWTFPADSLLILIFPEPFWISAGMAWGVGVLVIAGMYALAARSLASRAAQREQQGGRQPA